MHPSWTPLTAGTGQYNGGVWRTPDGAVVKRLVRGPEKPRHHAYWRRQALVGEAGLLERTPGLRAPQTLAVEEHAEFLLLWMRWVELVASDDLVLAAALGRFADAAVPEPPWGARDVLRLRLEAVARRGGWSSLDGVVDDSLLAALKSLWNRRELLLAELAALPHVPTHGDAHPLNLIGRAGDDVIAIDWEQFGHGPLGFDLATWCSPRRDRSTNWSAPSEIRRCGGAPYWLRRTPRPRGPLGRSRSRRLVSICAG